MRDGTETRSRAEETTSIMRPEILRVGFLWVGQKVGFSMVVFLWWFFYDPPILSHKI